MWKGDNKKRKEERMREQKGSEDRLKDIEKERKR